MKPLRYLLYPPKGEAETISPLIIFLHGSGERGDDLELVKKWSLPRFTESGEVELPAYIAVPQCPLDLHWSDVLDLLDGMLDELLVNHPIDADRVYLTGFSMGAFGVWAWAFRSPGRFAALMPVGGSSLGNGWEDDKLALLRDTPLWMIHGALDKIVPVTGADEVAAALAALGLNFKYIRYPDASHGQTSDRAFADMALYRWLFAQKRGKA